MHEIKFFTVVIKLAWILNIFFSVCLFLCCKQHSVRPNFGFGIENRNEGPISVFVSEPKFFFPKPKLFFQNFSNFLKFFCFLGGYRFLKAWNWTQIFKNNLKILNIWQQIWGPFMIEKIPHTRFSLSNVVTVSAESIS